MVTWLKKELEAWKPPDRMTVSEWADKYIYIPAQTSITSANMKWKTDLTPYLREIMDTYNDPYIEEVVFCKSTQVGGTVMLLNILGYIIDQEPSSMLVVYPTVDLAEYVSDNRIKPMIELCEPLKLKFQAKESQKLKLQFPGMYIALVGANSPAPLASRPIGKIFFDETDKYPESTGIESDPISLGTERSKNFRDRKIYKISTPTLEHRQIWQALITSEVIKQYYVPCPHCRHMQTFKLGQIKWPEEVNEIADNIEKARMVEELAWYECEECKGVILDKQKAQMLKEGEWRPVKYERETEKFIPASMPKGKVRRVGYHLNTIYSPWVSFGKVASKFIMSKDYPSELMNFVNSWLGEPWRSKTNIFKSAYVLKQSHGGERGYVPYDAGECILTAGVDRQKDHFWYVIHAWGERFTGKLVDYGRVETWAELEEVLVMRQYYNTKGQAFVIRRAFIDSGYDTDAVYDFCAMNRDICVPAKGANRKLSAPIHITTIERRKSGRQWVDGLKLYEVDTDHFKDFIFGRLGRNVDEPGSWSVFKDCPKEFADHLCSEQKIAEINKKTGKVEERWVPISSHAVNHLLDCCVYSAAAAENLGVRYLRPSIRTTQRKRGVINKGIEL